jgi:hypothetical protein
MTRFRRADLDVRGGLPEHAARHSEGQLSHVTRRINTAPMGVIKRERRHTDSAMNSEDLRRAADDTGFPGEMEEGHLRRKTIPHPCYPFENATHWRMRAEKCGRWPKSLSIQQFGR